MATDDPCSPDPERWPYCHGWGEIDGVEGYIWSNVPKEPEQNESIRIS